MISNAPVSKFRFYAEKFDSESIISSAVDFVDVNPEIGNECVSNRESTGLGFTLIGTETFDRDLNIEVGNLLW